MILRNIFKIQILSDLALSDKISLTHFYRQAVTKCKAYLKHSSRLFTRWLKLKSSTGCNTDDLAIFLMDFDGLYFLFVNLFVFYVVCYCAGL